MTSQKNDSRNRKFRGFSTRKKSHLLLYGPPFEHSSKSKTASLLKSLGQCCPVRFTGKSTEFLHFLPGATLAHFAKTCLLITSISLLSDEV